MKIKKISQVMTSEAIDLSVHNGVLKPGLGVFSSMFSTCTWVPWNKAQAVCSSELSAQLFFYEIISHAK